MSDRTCDLDDPGKACQRARNREGQQDQLVGVEATEPCGARGGADDADFKPLDGFAEQHRACGHHHERNDAAKMQPAALDQHRHGGDRIELGRGREVEAFRVAPRTAHQVIEQEIGDIDQHQAGEDFAGAEPHLADRRYQGVQRAADRSQQHHRRQYPRAGVGALRLHRKPGSGDGTDQELSFSADVPGVSEIAEREADRDHHQRRCLDRDFLQRIAVDEGIDEVDAERGNRVLTEDRKQDAHGHERQADRDQRRNQRNRVRPLGALFKHQLHAPLPSAPECFRPSAGPVSRGSRRRLATAPTDGHGTSQRCGR